ncbi:HEPN domain-containing protein [Caballeronia telluris]|uniref:HEPN domain protein n=1 Tax=Caballeronia telluris TaxID=326475 RepID=A0A158FHG1_9BURK|nr:HEPN domain-containing protein [Caballeronia telluris]SAL19053.1 hypothetical protein AWB66_00936 [Caballeronia telluris]
MTEFEPHGIHRMAGYFFKQSAEDYGAARCCLLHGLFPGFVMAEQAVEKLIKAFLLTADPTFKPKKGQGHNLAAFCARLIEKYPAISLDGFEPTIQLLQACYDGRYPDSAADPMPRATAELHNVDRLYMHLADQAPLAGDRKWSIGVFPHLYMAHLGVSNMPDGKWMLHGNAAAMRLLTGRPLPAIVERWRNAAALHPHAIP